MRAHRRNGTGEYVPCRAKDAGSCPYGADHHKEFESGTALMQYNTIEGTGHDWDELQTRYPSMSRQGWVLSRVMRGSETTYGRFENALETIIADDSVRDQRDTIASMDWSDPKSVLGTIAGELGPRSIRAYAAGAGVNDTDLPVEIVEEDLRDAYEGTGTARAVEQALERIHNRHAGNSVKIVEEVISWHHDLARAVALAIGRASGDLVPPEDAELPASSVRAFDERVRSEAVNQYPIAANRYADALRSVADGLESAMKRAKGIRAPSQAPWVGDSLKPWSEATGEKNRMTMTIEQLRRTADEIQANASLDMRDAHNAVQAADTLRDAGSLVEAAAVHRSSIGRDCGHGDEAFNTATYQCSSAYLSLGSTIRRTQGLRGYYARPVPGTDPITTGGEANYLKALARIPQRCDDSQAVPLGAGTVFLQDYGVTALRPDGSIETDPLKAIRRSITRRLATDRYDAMLGINEFAFVDLVDSHGETRSVPGEDAALSDRLEELPALSDMLGESSSEDERAAAYSRGLILSTITNYLG